ncbi:hypothetical protein JST97_24570 [bacterium]|nr:hypothetical protein [bacterium]
MGSKSQSGGKHHFAAATAQIVEGLAFLKASEPADLQGREIGCFSEAEVAERAVGEGAALQVDIQRQKAKKVEDPHQGFYLH